MNQKIKILVVDDSADFLRGCLDRLLGDPGIDIAIAESPQDCLSKVMAASYDILLLDVSFTPHKQEGLELISDIKCVRQEIEIIMFSGISDQKVIASALERGASNYITKASESHIDDLIFQVRSAVGKKRSEKNREIEGELLAASVGAVFVSRAMKKVFAYASVAGKTQAQHVLITGPTGVGKELVAKAIASGRRDVPYLAVNCGAITETLIGSELFGHKRGAFTGATQDKKGYFEGADGSSIFLDEVDTLSMKAQVSLLRFLQTGEFIHVGGTVRKKVNVRVISATNADLHKLVQEGKFREDLLARLNGGIEIKIPALSDRRDDIAPIIRATVERSRRNIQITPECMAFLEAYSWPQNIRQLIQVIDAMILLSDSGILTIGDIPHSVLSPVQGRPAPSLAQTPRKKNGTLPIAIPDDASWDKAVRMFQTQFLTTRIQLHRGPQNQRSIAKALGLSKGSLQRRLKELDISVEEIFASKQTEMEGHL